MSKHTPGALRAAKRAWGYHHGSIESLADLIDRETGLPELLEAAVAAYDCLVGVFGPVGCESFEEERWDDQDACETAFKLHAAIAKARGGAKRRRHPGRGSCTESRRIPGCVVSRSLEP